MSKGSWQKGPAITDQQNWDVESWEVDRRRENKTNQP